MSNYTKTTNFLAKDSLPENDSGKIIKGSEFDTEFNALQVAVNTKADLASPALSGVPTAPTATAGTNTTQLATTAFVTNVAGALGTISSQNANSVAITGGTIAGVAITGGTIASLSSALLVASGGTGTTTSTGTGDTVRATSPTLVTPALGTPSALVGTNITGTSNAFNAGIGVNQTWQTFTTTTRALGTTYTNSTGKSIMMLLGYGRSSNLTIVIGGVTVATLNHDSNNNSAAYASFIVPNGATYSSSGSYSADSGALYWSELR